MELANPCPKKIDPDTFRAMSRTAIVRFEVQHRRRPTEADRASVEHALARIALEHLENKEAADPYDCPVSRRQAIARNRYARALSRFVTDPSRSARAEVFSAGRAAGKYAHVDLMRDLDATARALYGPDATAPKL